ncbi:MAG: 5-carboxymethyl-2-hydroxymuconate Delta-isomerase, partial [Acidobacteriota bacterium]|nr:5-carboxymethyl-2-hydroxymuconate Delta-isomerase [Acidobacteriota bacterium]
MPHLTIEYSANLEPDVAVQDLVDALHRAAVETGVFPLGGI